MRYRFYSFILDSLNIFENMTHVNSYALGICISNSGAFGRVYLGKKIGEEPYYAIKVMEKQDIVSCNMKEQIQEEVRILKLLDHPNIIKIHDVLEDDDHVYIVFEHAFKGDLFDVLIENGQPLTEAEIKNAFYQIMSALAYMHKHNIIHRDLKLENVLMDEHGNVKIGDFGAAIEVLDVLKQKKGLMEICGTSVYASPEIHRLRSPLSRNKGPYDEKIDIWACGIILYELVFKEHPIPNKVFKYAVNTEKKLIAFVINSLHFDSDVDEELKNLILSCLNPDPAKRPTAVEILNNPWLNSGGDAKVNNGLPLKSNERKQSRRSTQ
jgi:Neu-associated kinase